MLSPKRTKFRKMQKGNNRGIAYRGSDVSFGDFGMQAVEPGRLALVERSLAGRMLRAHDVCADLGVMANAPESGAALTLSAIRNLAPHVPGQGARRSDRELEKGQ